MPVIVDCALDEDGERPADDPECATACVAMAAVPTLIAGVYGMNLDHMPELHWRGGDALVMVVMAVVVLALYRFFRNNDWL